MGGIAPFGGDFEGQGVIGEKKNTKGAKTLNH